VKQRITTAILLIATLNGVAFAQSKITVSPSFRNFYYKEVNDAGKFLDKETGLIAGLQGKITRQWDNDRLYASINAGLFDGRAQYDGHTQDGANLRTQTDETFYHAGLTLGENLKWLETPLSIYTSMEYHQWDRDILATTISQGLFERYKWWELSFGTIVNLIKTTPHNLTLNLSIIRTIRPEIMVDLSAHGYGKPEIDLVSKLGTAIELSYTLHTENNYQFKLAGKYKTWKFGASKFKTLSNESSTPLAIKEPDSTTHTVEMRFDLERRFF